MICRICKKRGKHWYKKYCPECAEKNNIVNSKKDTTKPHKMNV